MSMKNPSFELSEYLYSTFNYADSFSPYEEAEKLNEKLPPVIDITYLHVLSIHHQCQ